MNEKSKTVNMEKPSPTTIQMGIVQCYLDSCHFRREQNESISATSENMTPPNPEIRCEFRVNHRALNKPNLYEIKLLFYVDARRAEGSLYHLEIAQVGVFKVQGIEEPAMKESLFNGYCASLLYPFVRQVAATMTSNAGMPTLTLPLINFEWEYQQRQAQLLKQKQTEVITSTETASGIH